MTAQISFEVRSEDEAEFRAALAAANVPALLAVLVQLTGDLRWLEERYRPSRTKGLGDNDTGGLPEDVQDEIREAALEAVLAWRAGRPVAIPDPPHDLLVQMMTVCMGEPVPVEYGPMLASELGMTAEARTPQYVADTPPEGFEVLIIGAGMSGLAAAIKLQEAGVAYVIVERSETVGGTWLDNRYPGCGVDTPSHLYSYSFAQHDWSKYFALRDELHEYFEGVATDFGVRPHIRFRTEVLSATYDEDRQGWTVDVRTEGARETLRPKIVISAVGAFSRPRIPDIEGLGSFEGPTAHTARWPDGLDLTGKRVAVIGNGASGMQLVPATAGAAASMTIFQRSPQWAAPFEKFHKQVPGPVRFLFTRVPLYRSWYRLRLGWIFNDRIHYTLQKDPSWPHPERAINEVNDAHREFFTRHIVTELGDRVDLLDKTLPTYPPFGKRMLLDNGWFRTLTRDDVELVDDPIERIGADRVVTRSGEEYEADVLVLATGFDVVRFLAPLEIRGRSGRTLRETWDDEDARAYLGMVVPDFPNFFILYGPNAQTGHGGSLIGMTEIQMHYVMDVLRQMIEEGIGSVECRRDVYEAYNRRVDEAHEAMVWTHPGMDTYYRNSRGRVVVNNPFRVIDYWHMTRHAALSDYLVEAQRREPGITATSASSAR